MDGMAEILNAINTGGNAALLACAWFIWRASERLARIEKALSKFLEESQK